MNDTMRLDIPATVVDIVDNLDSTKLGHWQKENYAQRLEKIVTYANAALARYRAGGSKGRR